MRSLFTENEITALATLTFGFLDTDSGLKPELIAALDHLAEMGFVHRRPLARGFVWSLREIPPSISDHVAARVEQIEDMVAKDEAEEAHARR